MLPDGPLREVVVVGGGLVGWSAAAALKRRVPQLTVTILPLAPPPDALADRIASTLPSILNFHADLGLGVEDAVLRTRSSYRLGSRFEGWAQGRPDYVHAYAGDNGAIGGVPLHLLWARAAIADAAPPFETLTPAAALARAGRFVPPLDAPDTPWSDHGLGLVLDVPRYGAMLRAFALHVGVIERPGALAEVTLRGDDGFIEALALDDGSRVTGELFLDCTGPAALLHGQLGSEREDWRAWLPCDRVLFAAGSPPVALSSLDVVTATAAGWQWRSATPGATLYGAAYASSHMPDTAAAEALHGTTGATPEPPVSIAPGVRTQPWLRNCVALGDAAVAMEPLEWCNLHLAHGAIDRLIAMLPGRRWVPAEVADYNRQTLAEARRARDFAALHYAVSDRDAPFWRERVATPPPPSLDHTLRLFRDRGRLPFHEEETFSRESWLAVLFGQGVLPAHADPLAGAVPPADALRALEARRAAIAAAILLLPTLGATLAAQMRQLAR
jgi:tryptophan 7-halogenase